MSFHPRVIMASKEILNLRETLKVEKLRYLDLGCADGSVTTFLAEKIGAHETYGIDVDAKALEIARNRGVLVRNIDLSNDNLPFEDEHFHLVTAFEVIEHLINPDNMLVEVHRVLSSGGFFCLSTPNLASWINRAYLLLGYQPLGVEVSTKICAGQFSKWSPVGHVRAYTLRSLKELLIYYGFRLSYISGAWTSGKMPLPFKALDKFFSRTPSFARYIIITAQKPQLAKNLKTIV